MMRSCPRAPFESKAAAERSTHRHGRSLTYHCPCGWWHRGRPVACYRCGTPVMSDAGRPLVDPFTGRYHRRNCTTRITDAVA